VKTVREAVPFVLYVFLAFSTNCLDFFQFVPGNAVCHVVFVKQCPFLC